jgi:TM2 domain-containing membrane protein YozV
MPQLATQYSRMDVCARIAGDSKRSECECVNHSERNAMRNPGTAAVLSLIIPGVGQFYNGTFWRGVFWLIITPGLWLGSGGMLGWVCHVISAYTAYNYARDRPYD